MSTQFEVRFPVCPHCKRSDPPLELGLQAGGWYTSVYVYASRKLASLQDWERFIRDNNCEIYDEYGKLYTFAEFEQVVRTPYGRTGELSPASFGRAYGRWAEFCKENRCELTPEGLLKPKLGCGLHKGYGDGPWVYTNNDWVDG
jgi:hypothetical protein